MARLPLTNRTALVLLLAVLAGVGAGTLATLAGDGPARSALCGLAAAGGAVQVFDLLITQGRHGDPSAVRRTRSSARRTRSKARGGRG
ncbi:hypothetical protein ACFS5L_35730 [Streptomyces phyllanthi]|uniref:Uncharacterized protein n=1 Tax=Streptomyces phyllanthi TaxID=1803180 RepID=A0A5N8WKH2_9ACTN|nr:hypothetical protein [Streptomyces phyllanthi]MPY46755.1 hypothetical protein [Streptomyces phyllanthi]